MSDPTIDAARDVLAESLEEIRGGIAGLTVDQLNSRPAGGETNSVAVITTHALTSTRSYMSIAVAAPPPPRDRAAEFRTVAGDGFGGWVQDMIGRCLGLFEGVTFDPSIKGVRNWRPDLADDPVTASWALLYGISHLGQHVGHLHMTLELLRRADS
jgi:hypothetical protein